MDISEFDYKLREDLVARYPKEKREESRLMVLNRSSAGIEHSYFYEIIKHLRVGDVLVLNNSKVIPSRLIGKKLPYGGKAEIFLLREIEPLLWKALVRPGKKIFKGDRIVIKKNVLEAEIMGYGDVGERIVRFSCWGNWWDVLVELGHTPLPPYILKARKSDAGAERLKVPLEEDIDRERYQTVYATEAGSVAGPTAGFHFSEELFEKLRESGIELAFITLHIGASTFRPVTERNVESHQMHSEQYRIEEGSCEIINRARKQQKRIIAVGTTSVRVLETVADEDGLVHPKEGETELMILPGYRFRAVDALLTNFHLPRTTLFMLVSSFAGLEFTKRAYKEAVDNNYRFYSYGDSMLIV